MQKEQSFSGDDAEAGFYNPSTHLEPTTDEEMKAYYTKQEFEKEITQAVSDLTVRGAKNVPDEETVMMRFQDMGSKSGQIAQGDISDYERWSFWKNGAHLEVRTEKVAIQ